jgi:hypothetical protein
MQESKNNEHSIKVSIELPDTIYVGQRDIPIILKIENTTSEVLSIRNPARWENAYPHIKQGDKVISTIKVSFDLDVCKDIIQIQGNETLRIQFESTLDKIFSLEFYPSGKYEIYFSFNYEPIDEKKYQKMTFLQMIFTKKKKFIEEKSIISDIFTLYKQ